MDARAALLNFEKFFGCKIEFGAKTDQITFDKRAAELGLVGDDPYLNEILGNPERG
jgi:hypothetical protein